MESSGSTHPDPTKMPQTAVLTISLAALGWKPWGNVDMVIYGDGALGIIGWSNKEMLRLLRPRVPVVEPRGRPYRIADERRDQLEREERSSIAEDGNRVFEPTQIGGVSLRKGLLYSRVFIELNDRSRIKVLWMRRSKLHPSSEQVEQALRHSIGPKFTVA